MVEAVGYIVSVVKSRLKQMLGILLSCFPVAFSSLAVQEPLLREPIMA